MDTKRIPLKNPKLKDVNKALTDVAKYIKNNRKEKVLVILMFAGHGILVEGTQAVLTNEIDSAKGWYQFSMVEKTLR